MGTAHSSPLSTQPPAGETQPHNAPSTGALNFAKASAAPKPKAPAAPVTQGGGRRGKSRRNKNRKNKSNKNRKNKNRK